MSHFGFPSSDDNFSSAFDKSTGFDSGVGLASGIFVSVGCVNASSFLSSNFFSTTGAEIFVSGTVCADCGSDNFSKTFSVLRFCFNSSAQIRRHPRAGLRAARFRRRRARLFHHVQKIAFQILRRVVHSHFAGRNVLADDFQHRSRVSRGSTGVVMRSVSGSASKSFSVPAAWIFPP